jgi:hypothetical protein
MTLQCQQNSVPQPPTSLLISAQALGLIEGSMHLPPFFSQKVSLHHLCFSTLFEHPRLGQPFVVCKIVFKLLASSFLNL